MAALTREAFCYVADLVRRESAIVLEFGKEYLVESRLAPLVRKHGMVDANELVREAMTRADHRRSQEIVEALTTNETSWFRDVGPFAALTSVVLPDLASRRPGRSLRIWSAACSSGQEPYSIAMTCTDSPDLFGFRTEILGTDLSEEMVLRAKQGRYSQLEINRGLPATAMARHLSRVGTDWQISGDLLAMVRLQTLNLMRPFPGIGRFDIVFVRNVLIYFDMETKRDILRRVRQVLAPDGYLFLGAAETTIGVDDGWERVLVGRSAIYRPV